MSASSRSESTRVSFKPFPPGTPCEPGEPGTPFEQTSMVMARVRLLPQQWHLTPSLELRKVHVPHDQATAGECDIVEPVAVAVAMAVAVVVSAEKEYDDDDDIVPVADDRDDAGRVLVVYRLMPMPMAPPTPAAGPKR